MTSSILRPALMVLAGLVAAAAPAARAESAASSAASTASQAVGSLSTSIQGSSNSSSRGNAVAAGDYEVTSVAAVDGKPGTVRVYLKPAAAPRDADDAFMLDLPAAALGERGLSVGETVSVKQRPYGYEFARATTREAFFLVLTDGWMRELEVRPI